MNNISGHLDRAIQRCIKLKKSKKNKIIKKLFYSTHLSGPHIDFYDSPPSLNKSTLIDILKKFQRRTVVSIGCLLWCEKKGYFLHRLVVVEMINQINKILATDKLYWNNYGFDDSIIPSIHKTYNIYKLFLETYYDRLVKLKNDMNSSNSKIFKTCIKKMLIMDVCPNDLQKFGLIRTKQLIKEIESVSGQNFSASIDEYRKLFDQQSIKSDTEIFSTAMTHILMLHEKARKSVTSNIILPEPHKIKIKQMPTLIQEYNFESIVSGRYMLINDTNSKFYTSDVLLRLCAYDTIMGTMTTKLNINDIVDLNVERYFKQHQKIKKYKNSVSRMLKQSKYFNVGLSCLSEKLVNDNFNNKIEMLYVHLFRAIKCVVDVGLNYSEANLQLNIDQAKQLLKYFIPAPNEDKIIDSIVLQMLVYPSESAIQEFSYYGMNKIQTTIKSITESVTNSDYEFFKTIYNTPYPHDILMEIYYF